MDQLQLDLVERKDASVARTFVLKASGTHVGEANNFTSYDAFALGLAREDLSYGTEALFLAGFDVVNGQAGQMEYLQVQVTLHTAPNRADSDGDGLNDSEEVNLGRDGFQTNPWQADTDGDSISDSLEANGWSRSGSTIVPNPVGFRTDPTRADTDFDGFPDNMDRWPLQDAYVRIVVTPSPFTLITTTGQVDSSQKAWPYAIVRDWNGDVTVSRAYGDTPCTAIANSAYLECYGNLDHEYTLDVPDTATSATFMIEFWQDATRFGLQADVAAPITSSGSNVVTDTWALNDDLSGSSDIRTYTSQTIATVNGRDLHNVLTVVVEAFGGSRSDLYLVLPNDYSGLYNVTDAAGATVARRYVGESRFVTVIVAGVDPDSEVRTTATTYLVPRSAFFDSAFYRDLQDAGKLAASPYTAMKGYQNATASANSDDLQMTFSFDGLDAAGQDAVRTALLRNATELANKILLLWTGPDWASVNSPYLVGLPADVIRSVPLVAWHSSPSHVENVAAPPPLPFWVRLFTGDPTALEELLQHVRSALVTVENFFVDLGRALVGFGSWLGDLTSGNATRVASAVKAAQKVASQVFDALANAILTVIHTALDPLINLVVSAYNAWADGVAQLIMSMRSLSVDGFVRGLIQFTFFSAFALAIFAVIVAFSVAEKITNAMTLGMANLAGFVIGAVAGLIIGMLVVAAVDQWLGSDVIDNLLPKGFDDVTGAGFTVAQFLIAYELAQHPLKPVRGVETGLRDAIIGLMLLGAASAVKLALGDTVPGLIILVVLDAFALYKELSGVDDVITITGKGANLVRMWYPFLYPVTVAMNAVGVATAATDLAGDAGRLASRL